MANGKIRTLYLGTANGLYRARNDGESYSVACIGFQNMGSFRAPVVIDCENANLLYAGTTRSGMHRSADGGVTWQEIDSGIVYKDIWSIAQHPKTGTLVVGTSPASAFLSEDRGDTWTECEQLQRLPTTRGWHGPVPPHVSRLKWLTLHAADPNLVYGAIEEGWAIRSLDGGRRWEQIDNGVDHDGHSIAIMPQTPNVVVASTGKGMFRSDSQGDEWQEANEGLGGRHYTPAPLAAHPARPDVLVTAVTAVGPGQWNRPEGGDSAFIRSEDQGRTWRVSTRGLPQPCAAIPRALTADPEDADTFYAGMTDGSVWASTDGGDSFTRILGGLPAVMSICAAAQ